MKDAGGRIRLTPGRGGIERMEAHFHGQAFSPHRHDTYAIGITLAGVQSFHFRGERWHCLPGQCHILHPDETHDGEAGDGGGFAYRIVYVDPALVQDALGGKPLPFVAAPVVAGGLLPRRAAAELWDIDGPLDDDLVRTDLVTTVRSLLLRASRTAKDAPRRLDIKALSRVRAALAADPAEHRSMDDLERLAGLDRWTLARQFRAAFGTSPSRFRTLRRLDRLRQAVLAGTALAEAALEAGFADQSHMTRQFKQAYGLTPARWATGARCGPPAPG